ncbi:AAA family ATPase [Streptomyces sp. V3I7]|uniref:ATP-binding protein n=1 Tax=Streptomyces sp. V3I7 TaxID=3042278 RepID=UPI0027852A6D|nr:AAA family ATPase [Streptomyces sp. V3I7]MDQ0994610.1 putative ATPase [Streptomyces sp. V3I7]
MWTYVGGSGSRSASGGRATDELVGRGPEVAELRQLLADHRLVTVTGPVGVGKSRLATAVAALVTQGTTRRLVRVRWQGTGPAEPGSLDATVLRALTGRGARQDPDPTRLTGVRRGLRSPRTLLFLDDVDPGHTECLRLVQHLLMSMPALRVLVTSRHVLGLGEERVLRLAPLSVEAPRDDSGPAPAVELLLARARAVAGVSGDGEPEAAAEVCRLLEGVPLAIELAAAQTARHSMGELAELLERHQCWLSSPHPPVRRHRSLREAVGAGYVLCELGLRTVWGRASIFEDTFAETTATYLCAGGGVKPQRVPAYLAQLAAVGVLAAVNDPGGVRQPRYRMTRAAREFGAERLKEAGEFPVAAERRVTHCRGVAAVAENLWSTGNQRQAVQIVQDELADLTAMVRYALVQTDHAEAALETVVNLWFWWAVYGRAEEGREHLTRLLPLCESDGPATVRALWLTAWLTAAADPQTARTLLGRAWPAAISAGDDAAVGRIAHVEGLLALRQNDPESAAEHFEEAAELIPPGAPGGPSPSVSRAALAVVQAASAPTSARRNAHRALAADPEVRDDLWATLLARHALALADYRHGHPARAWHRAHRALDALDPHLPTPHGTAALRQLLTDIGSGAPAWLRPSSVPLPRTPEPSPTAAVSRASRSSR